MIKVSSIRKKYDCCYNLCISFVCCSVVAGFIFSHYSYMFEFDIKENVVLHEKETRRNSDCRGLSGFTIHVWPWPPPQLWTNFLERVGDVLVNHILELCSKIQILGHKSGWRGNMAGSKLPLLKNWHRILWYSYICWHLATQR